MFWFFLLFRNKYYYTDIFIFLCISLDWWKWVGVMHYVRRRTIKPSQNQEKHKRKSTKNEKKVRRIKPICTACVYACWLLPYSNQRKNVLSFQFFVHITLSLNDMQSKWKHCMSYIQLGTTNYLILNFLHDEVTTESNR